MNIIEANDIRKGDKVQLRPWQQIKEMKHEKSIYWCGLVKDSGRVWIVKSIEHQLRLSLKKDTISFVCPPDFILGHAF